SQARPATDTARLAPFRTGDSMQSRRLLKPLMLGIAAAIPAGTLTAQSQGNAELGVFWQYTVVDGAWHTDNGFGGGGRAGWFMTRRWQLEGDVGFSSFNNQAPRASGSSSMQTYTAQINYGIPFGLNGLTHQFLLEAGAGAERFAGHNDFTVPLGAGF